MGHIININPASGDISCDQNADFTTAELAQCPLPLALAFVAMQRNRKDTVIIQECLHPIRAKFGAGKDNGAFNVFARNNFKQRHILALAFNVDNLLADALNRFGFGRGFHQIRVCHQVFSQFFNAFWHGG